MKREQAPCLACATTVPRGLQTCPACGYAVGRHDRRRCWLGVVGSALTLSGVLAPIGLPLLWRARQHHLAATGSVTHRAQPALRSQLRDALHDFLALDPRGALVPESRWSRRPSSPNSPEAGQR